MIDLQGLSEAVANVFRTAPDGKFPDWLLHSDSPVPTIVSLPEVAALLEMQRLVYENATVFCFPFDLPPNKIVIHRWTFPGGETAWGVSDRLDPEYAFWWTGEAWHDGRYLPVAECYRYTLDCALERVQWLIAEGRSSDKRPTP